MDLTHTPEPRLTAHDTNWSKPLWAVLIALCGVVFLDALDVSMVGMALPSIQDDLGLTTSALQWVVSGYVLGYGGFLLLGGRAADLMGRRRVLLAALAVFVVASALGAVVSDGTLLIVARFIKGVAAAFTAPAAFSIITTTFAEGPARNKALGLVATVGSSGFSLGLVFGGLLTAVNWRLAFLVPAPLAALLFVAIRRYVPRDSAPPVRGGYDVPGAITVGAAMLLLVRTVVTAPDAGWGSVETIGGFAVTALLLAAFVVIERRTPSPLVRLGILRSGSLVRANLVGMALFGSYIGFQFIGTLYLQTFLGWSSIEASLAFLPAGLVVVVGSTRMAPLIGRFGTPRLLVAAFISLTLGYALFLRLGETASYVTLVLPTMLLLGVGFAIGLPSSNVQAMSGVDDSEQGLASGIMSTTLQIGGAVGVAIVSAVIASRTGTRTDPASLLASFRPGVFAAGSIALLGLLVAISGVVGRKPAQVIDVTDAPIVAQSRTEVVEPSRT